jgi:hypothetical protein
VGGGFCPEVRLGPLPMDPAGASQARHGEGDAGPGRVVARVVPRPAAGRRARVVRHRDRDRPGCADRTGHLRRRALPGAADQRPGRRPVSRAAAEDEPAAEGVAQAGEDSAGDGEDNRPGDRPAPRLGGEDLHPARSRSRPDRAGKAEHPGHGAAPRAEAGPRTRGDVPAEPGPRKGRAESGHPGFLLGGPQPLPRAEGRRVWRHSHFRQSSLYVAAVPRVRPHSCREP